ncbi:MAG: NAD/NADP octopine/nopaline dehydrogenase family protein [bacterium]|nr:NAD/NADP octopine/nopaline dehydrogenase family protein [bacterium]
MSNFSNMAIAVLGGGNCAHSLSCYLTSLGCSVRLWARNLNHLSPCVRKEHHIEAYGKLSGVFNFYSVSNNLADTIRGCKMIFVATVTTAYEDVAAKLAPYLESGQTVVMFSSKLAGSVIFSKVLHDINPQIADKVTVAETDALFASRLQSNATLWVRGIKRWNLVCTPRRRDLDKILPLMQEMFPGLLPADNVIQRGLSDFGALAHPLTMIANMNRVDRAESWLFYMEGFTPNTIALMEEMEKEFQAIAQAYGTKLDPAVAWLNNYYGCDTSSLYNAMRSVPNYQTSKAPTTLDHRYVKEDVCCTLVPVHYLGILASVPTPLVDAVITITQVLSHDNFYAKGRNLSRLGWDGLTCEQIKERIS